MIDSGFEGRHSWIEGSDFSILGGVEDLINALGVVQSLPFHPSVCSAHESLKSSHFRSRLPFRVFTLESHFFIFL